MPKRKTAFLSVPASPSGVRAMLDNADKPLVLVSRHGLGDNVFFSVCFGPLKRVFGTVFFCSCVNAYTSIFHESGLVRGVYAGSVNGADLGLRSAEAFARHFEGLGLDLGMAAAQVYHFGLFDPDLPYSDERAFVKGRRNFVELFGTGPSAVDTPVYHVAPDRLSLPFVHEVLDRWLAGRELICIARYGHTDVDKNFGHCHRDTLEVIRGLNRREPDRFAFLSFDYLPGDHAVDGRAANVRSVYGFLPCDAASMYHILARARLLITVPSGPMVVGATVPGLQMLTLWRTMCPYHLLDPQFDGDAPVHALVETEGLASRSFMREWPVESRDAVLRRWRTRVAPVTSESVVEQVVAMLGEVAQIINLPR